MDENILQQQALFWESILKEAVLVKDFSMQVQEIILDDNSKEGGAYVYD